jgi:hypothetical protein
MKLLKTYLELFENSDELIKSDINTLEIKSLNYYEIIELCGLGNLKIDKLYKDQWEMGYCDYIKKFKNNPNIFLNNYIFLIGIKNEKLVSLFYKVLNENPNFYGDGYIISTEKGTANKMFLEMKKYGSFTTFSNLENIASIKAQLKIGAEILNLSSNAPDKGNGLYNAQITNENILELIKNEKIYFNDTYTNEKFLFMNKHDEIDLSKLSQYLIRNDDIKLVYPKDKFKKDKNGKTSTGLKIYFFHKKK